MTTILDVAHQAGVRTKQARRVAQRVGVTIQDRKGYKALDEGSIQILRAALAPVGVVDECRLPDHDGLPLEALSDPMMREAFTLLRFQREARLMALVCGHLAT